MASLRFHKVSSLPGSCTLGDVYYVVGKGIYVCTTAANSGAIESTNYTRFSYSNDAANTTKGVVSLNDVKGVKVDSATAADTAGTATNYADGGSIATKFTTIDNSIGKINASVSGQTLTITKPNGDKVTFTDTNTHNSHGHTFTANTATSTSGIATEVEVVSALGNANATDGNLSSSYDKVKVPTLKVTNDLKNTTDSLSGRISSLESVNATGMQYKGTRTDGTVPANGKVGDVYKVTTKVISGVGAEVGDFIVCNKATETVDNSAWDVWQANVNKDAYWDNNTPVSGNFVYAADANGKLQDSGKNADSFADKSHTHPSSEINKMTGYAMSTAVTPAAISTTDSLNTAIGKLEKMVNNAQTTATNKWTKETATQANGGAAVEGTVIGHFADTTGFSKSPIIDGVVYYKDTDTHHTAAFTITNGTTTAQSFAQSEAKSLAIKASPASGSNLTASTSTTANSGILTVNVGVASGYTIPSDTKIAEWNNKWDKAYAKALAAGDGSKAGVATFDSNSFTVSDVGHVGLAWATWA